MSLVAGRLTERLGARVLAVAGSLACLSGTVILLTSDLDAAGEVRLPLALLGIGLGLCGPAAQTASLSAIAPQQSGMAAGVSSTMRYLGGVAGIAMLGILLDVRGSRAAIVASHHTVVAVFTGVLVLATRLRGSAAGTRAAAQPGALRRHPGERPRKPARGDCRLSVDRRPAQALR